MDKREIILDAMRALFIEGTAGTASVSDIAKKAGIAKGGLYYYFRSKEEVLDALVEREYGDIIRSCRAAVQQCGGNALQKFAVLLHSYQSAYVDPSLDAALHMPQNAAIHQKSLAQILSALSGIVADIITEGVEQGLFICAHPREYAEMVLSVFTFLLDPGIFTWTREQYGRKLQALADLLEKGLCTPQGSFAFLYAGQTSPGR